MTFLERFRSYSERCLNMLDTFMGIYDHQNLTSKLQVFKRQWHDCSVLHVGAGQISPRVVLLA